MPTTFQNKAGCRPPGCYTYAYLRASDSANGPAGSPWYVGKGTGNRAWARHGSPKKYWAPPSNEFIVILKWGMTNEEANRHEMYMIAVLGNRFKDGGFLTGNYNEGGGSGNGYVRTEEERARLSAALKGRVFSDDHKKRLSASRSGFQMSEDQKRKIAASLRGKSKSVSPQGKLAIAISNQSREWTAEARKKVADARRGSRHSDQTRAKMSEVRKGVPQPAHQTQAIIAARYRKSAEKIGVSVEFWSSLTSKQRDMLRMRYARGLRGAALLEGLL
jgi:hypothetical protein